MSLLDRLFGRRTGDPNAEGIAHYEAGRFAEAVDALRHVAGKQRSTPAGSLASFHLRLALVARGRELLRAGQPTDAVAPLQEAATAWESFADLQFLLGTAQGLMGDWTAALASAHAAERLNPDYCEARLLAACALVHLGREREAAASLNKLLESGRRVDNPLVTTLARADGYDERNLPANLDSLLARVAVGEDREAEVAAAVALCRGGHWQQGVARLQDLVARHPEYPDYRVKLAAALFQVGDSAGALAEVDQALRLNPAYRTASILKALILADHGRLESAHEVLALVEAAGEPGSLRGQEDLLAAYLAGVTGLLTGRTAAAAESLAGWGEMTSTFPRAELLRVALADLAGKESRAAGLLEALAGAWPTDPDYQYFFACFLLQQGDQNELQKVLARWPTPDPGAATDDRPLRLTARLALQELRDPELPPATAGPPSPAWRLLVAEDLARRRRWQECWQETSALLAAGNCTEEVVRLQTEAAAHQADRADLPPDWLPPAVLPSAVVPALLWYYHRQERAEEAERLLARYRDLHPEQLRWTWLAPAFWLDPVRRWIG